MGNLITFCSSIFVNAHDRTITSVYKHAYFVSLIFMVYESTVKAMKIGPLENFPLHANIPIIRMVQKFMVDDTCSSCNFETNVKMQAA